MRIKLKLKANDYSNTDIKRGIVSAIKETEDRFPHLELVHVSGYMGNELKLFNLETDEYVDPKNEMDFISELNSKLSQLEYKAIAHKGRVIIDTASATAGEERSDNDDLTDVELDLLNEAEEEDELDSDDTPYRYGQVTARKLEEFLNLYGRFLEDQTAELNYNRSKSKWGPRFRYDRGDNQPSEEIKEEIKQYINDIFYN